MLVSVRDQTRCMQGLWYGSRDLCTASDPGKGGPIFMQILSPIEGIEKDQYDWEGLQIRVLGCGPFLQRNYTLACTF